MYTTKHIPLPRHTDIHIALPAGPGGAQLPNALWCNSQLKICKSFSFTNMHQRSLQQPYLCFFTIIMIRDGCN